MSSVSIAYGSKLCHSLRVNTDWNLICCLFITAGKVTVTQVKLHNIIHGTNEIIPLASIQLKNVASPQNDKKITCDTHQCLFLKALLTINVFFK